MTKQEIFFTGSKVEFVADGKTREFELLIDSTYDMIDRAILEGFESYRHESLTINGINLMFPYIRSGYMVVEGKTADILTDKGKQTYFSLKDTQNIMKLGIRKGDVLHLKGISSFTVNAVEYGDRILCLDLV